jgi:uncharacterized protein (DUF1697 family)
MALVIFMRAVNIGGHQTFQPSKLARDLAEYDVKSIGAAGTFVVLGKTTEARLRKAVLSKLTIAPEMMIASAKDVAALAELKSFKDLGQDVHRYVTVMASALPKMPKLPISLPGTGDWQMRIAVITGPFALSYRRSVGQAKYYPNEVIEKRFGVAATTRNWTTITKIHDILASRG